MLAGWRGSARSSAGGAGSRPSPHLTSSGSGAGSSAAAGSPSPASLLFHLPSRWWWSARQSWRRCRGGRGGHRSAADAGPVLLTAADACGLFSLLSLLLLLALALLGSLTSPLSLFSLRSVVLPPSAVLPLPSWSLAGGANHYSDPSEVDVAYPPLLYDRPASSFAFPLTIVTAYWPFPSKHSSEQYQRWLRHFLSNFTTPMVVFTSPAAYPLLASLRYARLFLNATPAAFTADTLNALHLVRLELRPDMSLLQYRTMWRVDFPSALDIPLLHSTFSSTFTSQLSMDPERAKHSPLLYATWTAKPFLVNLSAALNPFHSKLFCWMDAGQFRNPHSAVTRFPSTQQVEALFHDSAELPSSPPYALHQPMLHPHPSASPVSSRQHKLVMVLVHPYTPAFCEALDPATSHPPHLLLDHHAGQSFIASAHSARWYSALYYDTAVAWAERAWLIGKDQTLMNALVQGYRGSFIVVGAWQVERQPQCWMGIGWDAHWSWMGSFLAAEEERLQGCVAEGERQAHRYYDVQSMSVDAQDVCSEGHEDWRSRLVDGARAL